MGSLPGRGLHTLDVEVPRDGCEPGVVHVLPALHERVELADMVRLAFDQLDPDAVVVELPSSMEHVWRKALLRLPAISALLFETGRGATVCLPVHPGDPLVEGGRLALEHDIPLICGDLDVDGYADYRDPAPDAYAVTRVGPGPVYRAFEKTPRAADRSDLRREASMAFHGRRAIDEGAERVLLICGMHHARSVCAALRQPQAEPLTPPRRANARLFHLHPDSLSEILGEIPFYIAAYEARRVGLPPLPENETPKAAGRDYGPFRVLSGGRGDQPDRLQDAVHRAARRGGWSSWEGWLGGMDDSAVGNDTPAAAAHADENDEEVAPTPGPADRLRLQWALFREAESALVAAAPDEKVERWQRRNFARYSRNLARLSGQLIVDLFDLLVAARGCVSENFAWELHRLATGYPWQAEKAADAPTAHIRAEELFDGVRRIKIRKQQRRVKRPGWEHLLRRRADERFPGEWLTEFDSDAICSYPPEDLIVENFGRYLKQRGKLILSEDRSRTTPFTTSVLDGIDVRETIRHWTEGKIWVRELGRVPGNVGSVVVIFDEDDEGEERYPHCQTWLGEHEQESDMAFYCTEPAQGVVGPGICRTTYGGFMLSSPPRRMLDVWTDADYRGAERKSEVLLLASLDYSEERVVVHVAARPPRAVFHRLAGRLGRKILHVPIGTLSPTTLKRIRVMHILSGYDKREIARDFIW